jgi:glutaredoxin
MTDRIIYVSRNCPHCKKLLIGLHRYSFLKSQFRIIDVSTQNYPDYIQSVPTLVANQQMIKNDDVFGYMNNMVEQIFRQNPQLREKYHPQQQQQQQQPHQQQQQQQPQQPQHTAMKDIGQQPSKINGPLNDPVDDLVGWCPDGGCSFAPISESNDDCSKQNVSLEDTRFSFISESDEQLPIQNIEKVPMQQNNDQFQKTAKQQQMDSSYERLMAERQLIK